MLALIVNGCSNNIQHKNKVSTVPTENIQGINFSEIIFVEPASRMSDMQLKKIKKYFPLASHKVKESTVPYQGFPVKNKLTLSW